MVKFLTKKGVVGKDFMMVDKVGGGAAGDPLFVALGRVTGAALDDEEEVDTEGMVAASNASLDSLKEKGEASEQQRGRPRRKASAGVALATAACRAPRGRRAKKARTAGPGGR